MKLRILVFIVFAFAAGLVWLPFHAMDTLEETRWTEPRPAGEIRGGFTLEQHVTPLAPANRKSGGTYCFGIRFATYQRRNQGQVVVRWVQQDQQQEWTVRARRLVDNRFRYFCPDAATRGDVPFDLRISGRNGAPGKSPTVWLVEDDSLGVARVNGRSGEAGLSLKLAERTRIGWAGTLHAGGGAFLWAWLCSVLIGLMVLGYALRPSSSPAPASGRGSG